MHKQAKTAEFSIGIIQTASHPALDAARDGFIDTLKKRLGNRVDFIIQNAQGSVDTMHAIAQRMHTKKTLDGFFAIATPALQAISAFETKRPIVFAAVTNPAILGVDKAPNITGATDAINIPATIDMIQQIAPQVKSIALLYTSAETNSVVMAKEMRKIMESHGFKVIETPIHTQADIPLAVNSALRKADAILAPTDNNVAAAIDLIASIALAHKKPLFVSDNLLVSHQALAARGIDYAENGKQAANSMYNILTENKKANTIPYTQPISDTLYIHKNTLERLALSVPKTLKEQVIFIK